MIFLKQFILCFIVSGTFAFTSAAANRSTADTLIDGTALQRQGLIRPWFTQVQMDIGRDRVESVHFDGELLTVQTKRGVIQTIDGETGETLWVRNVDSPSLFTSEVGVGPNHIAIANGSHLLVFDRTTGKQLWARKLTGGVIGAPGVSNDYVFVPKVDGNLEVYSLDKPRPWKDVRSVVDTQFPVWRYNSHGKTMVQPTVLDGLLGWANDRAAFYVARIKPMEILFRLETFQNVVAAPVKINSYLYIISADGYLYKVNVNTGDIRWRFSTGTPLVYDPVAVDGFIYISTPNGGLYRILADEEVAKQAGLLETKENNGKGQEDRAKTNSLKEGNELWFNPVISRILSVSRDRVFGLDKKGNLQIVDTQTGKSLGSISATEISNPLTNKFTDRIYLATENGLIQCIRESNRLRPEKHSQTSSDQRGANDNPENPEDKNNPFGEDIGDSETIRERPADDVANPFE